MSKKFLGLYLEEELITRIDEVLKAEREVTGYKVSRSELIRRAVKEGLDKITEED